MKNAIKLEPLQTRVLYRAARYIFQHVDAIEQDFCLPDMKAQTCPYSKYVKGVDRDPSVCAHCLVRHFEQQEQAVLHISARNKRPPTLLKIKKAARIVLPMTHPGSISFFRY